jgi:hypothetical protein
MPPLLERVEEPFDQIACAVAQNLSCYPMPGLIPRLSHKERLAGGTRRGGPPSFSASVMPTWKLVRVTAPLASTFAVGTRKGHQYAHHRDGVTRHQGRRRHGSLGSHEPANRVVAPGASGSYIAETMRTRGEGNGRMRKKNSRVAARSAG